MIASVPDGVVIDVRVVTRAGRSGVDGVRDGSLLVRLLAPPIEGAANAELIEVIADALEVPRREVTLVSGDRSRRKRVHVVGVSEEEARRKLAV